MNILFGERRSGRTTELIKQAVKENAYILVYDRARAHFVRKLATELGYPELLFPITFQELMNSRNTGFVKKLLIDDADDILESLCVRQGWEVLMMALCKREGQFFELPGNGKPPEMSPELKRYVDYMIARAVRNITVRYDWHDAKKEKPKTNGVYIVTRRIGYVDTCYFDGSDTWHDDTRVNHGREYINDIVAWMPLPKPYKAGDDV